MRFETRATHLPSALIRHLSPFSASPLKLLEIGAFEGGSTTWFQRYMLTHEESTLLVVDTWKDTRDPLSYNDDSYAATGGADDKVLRIFEGNVRASPNSHKVTAIRGDSGSSLAQLIAEGHSSSFDFQYIDGSHRASEVLLDVALAFRLLKKGGLMLLDDYRYQSRGRIDKEGEGEGIGNNSEQETDCSTVRSRRELTINEAIDAVLGSVPGGVEVLFCGYQLLVRKLGEAYDVKSPVVLWQGI